MRRLRETWLALGGSALIIALSVTSALGARPALDAIENVGQQVSEFAQTVNGQNQDGDEPEADEQPDLEEDEQLDEADEVGVDTDEDTLGDDEGNDVDAADEEAEPGDPEFDWTAVSHGFCVSWHAQADENDTDDDGTDGEDASDEPLEPGDEGYDWANHGEFVSWWARVGCDTEDGEDAEADEEACEAEAADTDEDTLGDDQEAAGEVTDEEACEDTDDEVDAADEEPEPGDPDFDWTAVSHGFCVSWHAHQDETDEENAPEDKESWKNHGEFVSYWATVGCETEDGDDADADEAEAADAEEDEEEDSEAAKAERKAEREAARAERKAQREAARAEREAARQNQGQNGNGNGRGRGGGGRP